LKIRAEQMAELDAQSHQNFERRLAEYLRKEHGGLPIATPRGGLTVATLPMTHLATMVRYSVAKAQEYGITWESGLASFTVVMFVVGPHFDQHPPIRKEITDPAVPANSMMDHLCLVVPAEIWSSAQKAEGREAWIAACPDLRLPSNEGSRG
jgi:hypothetical protein